MVRGSPTRAMYLNFHGLHRCFRDSIHGVNKWLTDVLLSSQALQATPQFVGYIPIAPGHQITCFHVNKRNRLQPVREISGQL